MAREIKTFNLQIVCNIGNYESIRLGAEWSPEDGADMSAEMVAMDAELRKAVYNMLVARKQTQNPVKACEASNTMLPASDYAGTPKEQPKSQKQKLTFKEHAKTLQAIVKRIEGGVSIDEVLKYYEPDEEAMRAMKMAAELSK